MNKLKKVLECDICAVREDQENFFTLTNCKHYACNSCQISHFLTRLALNCTQKYECPSCEQSIHPDDVWNLLKKAVEMGMESPVTGCVICERDIEAMFQEYQRSSLRYVLVTMDGVVWCPSPDCYYAVEVSNFKRCPKFLCPVCGETCCTRCRSRWHDQVSCAQARERVGDPFFGLENLVVKKCPRCSIPITKLDDGSCNHMQCVGCKFSFCWLCLKPANNLHFLTPSGCTYYGKKTWSPKKRAVATIVLLFIGPVVIAIPLAVFTIIFTITFPYMVLKKSSVPQKKSTWKKLRNFLYKTTMILATPLISVGMLALGIVTSLSYLYIYYPITTLTKYLKTNTITLHNI